MNGRKHNAVLHAGLTQDLIPITIHPQPTYFFNHFSSQKNKETKTQRYAIIRWMTFLLLSFSNVFGNIIYVNSNAPGMDGSSWANAYNDLQDALDVAERKDQIWVAAGTYTPAYDYGLDIGSRGKHFRLINGVAIYGGFTGTETALEQRDIQDNETILSGEIGSVAEPNDNCYHVFYHPYQIALDSTAALDGFTITGGNANHQELPHYFGGGMYNEDCSPSITNCTFTDNTALYGGGMYNFSSAPTVAECTFSSNSASGDALDEPSGGGMSNQDCNPMLISCTFLGNTAHYGYGAGMDNYYSNPFVFDCFFGQNSAVYGAGMNNLSSSPLVTDSTFSENTASGDTDSSGGGISNFLEENSRLVSNPTITRCIFSGNTAVYGAGIENEYRNPTVRDCSFSGNTADDGGGIYNFFSSTTITACTFEGNTALYGGGISNEDSNSIVVNSIFIGNSADYGGGVENYSNCDSTFINCTLSGNTADFGGGMDNFESNPSISNTIFWANTAISGGDEIYNDASAPLIAFSDILGGLPFGSTNDGGNITEDPRFVQMPDDGGDGWGDANDDYGDLRLQGDSLCIDAGDNTAVTEATDIKGGARMIDADNDSQATVDMGAYESDDPCLGRDKADFNCDGIVNMEDFVDFASSWLQ